jgi:hypothetical protein
MHRKYIRRWHKLLSASASLIAILAGVVIAPASANSAPAVTMFWADVSRTSQLTATFYLMTNVTVTNLEASDFSILGSASGCAIDSSFMQSSMHVVTVTGCSDGSVALQLGANSISDLAGNWGPAMGAVSDFTIIDRTAPVFTFDPAPASVADGSFVLTASINERADLAAATMSPTVKGEGCTFAGITYATQSISFAITGCKPAAEVSVTILAKSFVDLSGHLAPSQDLVSPVVKVASAVVPSPEPTPTATPTPTFAPSPSPTPEATAALTLPVEPPSPAAPIDQPAPKPEPVFEAEPVVPIAEVISIRAIESAERFELAAPPAARRTKAVFQALPMQPETLTNPIPAPRTEVDAQTEPQAPARAISPATNLSWVMPAASVISAAFGAVAGALIVRGRQRRNLRLRIA